VFGSNNDVRRDHDFKTATKGQAIDGRDDGLVEARQFLQAAETAHPIVCIRRFACGCGLEIPAGTEEFVACGGEDGHAQFGIVPEFHKDIAHDPAGCSIDGVGLGAVDGDFKHGAMAFGYDG
jgi:hypothetical protein